VIDDYFFNIFLYKKVKTIKIPLIVLKMREIETQKDIHKEGNEE
jgi:hypothetical protein